MTDYEKTRYENYKKIYSVFMMLYPFEIEDLEGESWKSTTYYPEDYQISTFGRVKSLKNGKVKILKPYFDKDGYLLVDLCRNSKVKKCKVHRLVAEAFILNPLGLPEVNHKFGVKFDNYYENLEWCTSLENNRHAYGIGLHKSGEEHFNAKLTNEEADWCRRHYIPRHPKFGAAALARKFNMHNISMWKIVTGKTYITAPIVGTTAVKHIEEAVSALEIKLDAETIKKLEAPYVPHIKTGAF